MLKQATRRLKQATRMLKQATRMLKPATRRLKQATKWTGQWILVEEMPMWQKYQAFG